VACGHVEVKGAAVSPPTRKSRAVGWQCEGQPPESALFRRDAPGITIAAHVGDIIMRRRLGALLLVLTVASSAFAQDAAVVDAPTLVPRLAADQAFGESRPAHRQNTDQVRDKKFWAVAVALNTAMVVDTRSTFTVLARCATCQERNPLVAPFVNRGPGLTYAAGELFDAGVMAIAAKMKGSPRPWARRTWWVLPASLIIGHSIAAKHNYGLLR
jgi:hypothetical protein